MDSPPTQIVRVAERLDSANVEEFKQQAQAGLASAAGLVVDFSATRFIDSVGLGALVSLLKSCSQRRVPIALAALSPQVRQIFELTRLYRLFDIYDTPEQACSGLVPT